MVKQLNVNPHGKKKLPRTRPLALSFKCFAAIVSMLTNISEEKTFVANFHFTKQPSNLSYGDWQTLKEKFIDSN
jgi:hypothetical protein